MKFTNPWALALALAVAGTGTASATETIFHVAGAASFRAALITAEVNYLASVTTGTVTGAYAGTSGLTGNNVSLVEAPTAAGTIVFENNLAGAVGGVEALSSIGNPIAFPTDTGLTLATVNVGSPTQVATGGTANVTFTNESTYPDLAFSDNTLATTQDITNLASSKALSASEAQGVVGVVVYDFLANTTSDVTDFGGSTISTNGGVTSATETVTVNVTPQNFSRLFSAGALTSSKSHPEIFTGNPADSTLKIYSIGRDIDAGARATILAETGYKLLGSGSVAVTNGVVQNYPLDGSGNIVGNVSPINPIASFETVPNETVDGIALNGGNGGYNSSGNEGKGLSTQFTGLTKTVEIGYIAASDAYSALTATATNRQPAFLLGYNGSTFNPAGSTTTQGFATQTDINKVYYGQYTLWGYEHLFYNSNNANGSGLNDSTNPSSIVSSLYTQLQTDGLETLSSGGVKYSSLIVSRSDDGLQVQ